MNSEFFFKKSLGTPKSVLVSSFQIFQILKKVEANWIKSDKLEARTITKIFI